MATGREHHRDIQGGAIRASIFGVSDGLVTNVSLILGIAGADAEPGIVRLAGFAGLVAGAVSMAAGEYVSMSAQRELLERELEIERRALAADPAGEQEELAALYRSRGVPEETAVEVTAELMREPELALEVHAREELGVNPESLGSPYAASISSMLAFALGGLIPLLPWFFARGTEAVVASVVLASVAALCIGAIIGASTGRGVVRSALRQLLVGAIAGATTYAIGAVLGVRVS
jgi:VIT1/CCC1 family predicted Fe2+/Mn2+ transporter